MNKFNFPLGLNKKINPLNITKNDINPIDFATPLSRINRYGGQGLFPYSVAQHCVLLSFVVPPELAKAALTHDMTEIWLGDTNGIVKAALAPDLDKYEKHIQLVIGKALDIPYVNYIELFPFDTSICADEMAALQLPCDKKPVFSEIISIEPLTEIQARNAWLNRYKELFGE